MSYVEKAMRTDGNYEGAVAERIKDKKFMRLLHCAMGLCTETGELMDILKRHLFYGTPIDLVHIKEEFGDLEWYTALGYDVLVGELEGMTRDNIRSTIQDMNIAKLTKRYPEKFTEHHAVNRNLEVERSTLEEHS